MPFLTRARESGNYMRILMGSNIFGTDILVNQELSLIHILFLGKTVVFVAEMTVRHCVAFFVGKASNLVVR